MQQKFIANLAFVLILNLLVKPFYILGIDTEVLKQVGEEVYGNYFALISFSFLMNIFLDAGITNFNTRNIAQHSQLLQKHFSNIIIVRLLLAFAYLVLILGLGMLMGYSSSQLLALSILGFNQVLVAFVLYFRSNLSGLHLFVQDSVVSVLDRLLLIVICGTLLWGGVTNRPFEIEWFIYAQTFAYGVTALIAFLLVFRQSGRLKLKWNVPFTYAILKQSAPYALLILLMSVYYRSDSVMLERMLPDGAYHAGVYAQGFRFFEASNMLAYLFAALLLPIFSRMIKEQQAVDDLLGMSFKILISGALVLGLGCVFYAEPLLNLRYDSVSLQATQSFAVLMLCFVAVCSTYIFGTLLTANGSLRLLNFMAAGGVLLNIVLNLVLIPKYFALGSAVASLITQALTAIAQIILAVVVFKLPTNFSLLRSFVVFLGGVILLGYFTQNLFINPLYNLLLMVALGLLWSFVTRMLSLRMMTSLLHYRR